MWKLDRFARSLSHLVATIEDLGRRGVGVRSLTEPIDTTSASGRLLLHVVGAMAEFERELIRERTQAGLDAARARGTVIGRPPTVSTDQAAAARDLLAAGRTMVEVASILSVSRGSLYRALARPAS